MDNKEEYTHIRISEKVKLIIEKEGKYGESHDKILRRLLKIK